MGWGQKWQGAGLERALGADREGLECWVEAW